MPRDGQIVPTRTTAVTPQLVSYAFGAAAAFFSTISRRSLTTTTRERRMSSPLPEPAIQPHPIPHLPLFDELATQLRTIPIPDLDKTVLVCRQHNLETTANVYRFAKQLGLTVFGTGKIYSSAPAVCKTISNLGVHLIPDAVPSRPGYYQEATKQSLEKLWARIYQHSKTHDTRRIIILDDGGALFETTIGHFALTYSMAGVEQTRGGFYSSALQNALYPIVEVASSAAKRTIEAPLIAQALLKKIMIYIPTLGIHKDCVCGIVGNGTMGSALTKYLLQAGYRVIIYDQNGGSYDKIKTEGVCRVANIEMLIFNSDYIFGCTGADITTNTDIASIYRDKTFISCTSEDREFRSLLRQIPVSENYRPLSHVVYTNNRKAKITFLYGGFPCNFAPFPQIKATTSEVSIPNYPDTWNVPSGDIEVTQSLMILGLMQSLGSTTKPINDGYTNNQAQFHCLNPFGQRAIATRWLQLRGNGRFSGELIKNFQDIDWIIEHSGGKYVHNKLLEDCIAKLPVRYDEPVITEQPPKPT